VFMLVHGYDLFVM